LKLPLARAISDGVKRLEITSIGGVAAAVAAVVVSSCCALPMALVFAGVSTSAVGLLGPLHTLRPLILALAVVLLGVAWVTAIRRRATRVYLYLAVGTALVALSFAWAWWDPLLQRLVMQSMRR